LGALRIAVVTGATGAIGRAIVAGIARWPEFQVVMVARDAKKAERLTKELERELPAAQLRTEIADLSRAGDIRALAERLSGPLHVLVNNAAIAPRRRSETPEGIELQLATNVLAYFWLTAAVTPLFESGARVVNVASYWAGDLDVDDLEFRRRHYDNGTAYRQSKQANRMLTAAQAEVLAPRGVRVNACHPGDVSSTLSHDLGFGGSTSPEDGADTPVWLATSEECAEITGRYFESRAAREDRFARDRAAVSALEARLAEYPS
jgi:retinol dehydrogenase 12